MSKSIQLKDKNNNKYYPHPYYPVGSIYLSVNNINPTRWFGGTWELIAQGRTLVGVDTSDTDFNTVKKTGGNKTKSYTPSGSVEAHSHGAGSLVACYDPKNSWNNALFRVKDVSGGWTLSGYMSESRGWNNGGGSGGRGIEVVGNTDTKQPAFTGSASNINVVQPYFTCYIWCRTA